MIVGEQKPLAEIKKTVAPYKKLLILGCGTCVKTCFAGGEDEVATLASALRLTLKKDGEEIEIEELTIERQCEDEFIQEAAEAISRNDAVLSLACGAGVQGVGVGSLPEGIAELCRREIAVTRLSVDAAVGGDRQAALQCLLLDPVITDLDVARQILDDYLDTYREHLPQFWT